MGENSSTTPASGGTYSPRSKSDALKPEASAREIPPKPDAQQASDPSQRDVASSGDLLPTAAGPPLRDGDFNGEAADDVVPRLFIDCFPGRTEIDCGTLELGSGSLSMCSGTLTMECGGTLDLDESTFDLIGELAGAAASADALVVPASAGSWRRSSGFSRPVRGPRFSRHWRIRGK